MGKLSDKIHSARRPGKRERARRKKRHRMKMWCNAPGAGTCTLKAGRKKWLEFVRSKRNPFGPKYEAQPIIRGTESRKREAEQPDGPAEVAPHTLTDSKRQYPEEPR